jgi:dTDP-4-dehydrorhamnose reductase
MNDTRRLLITGAQGFVAGSMLAQAGNEWEMHAVSRAAAPAQVQIHWHVCDPLAQGAVASLFSRVRPAVVIHTAAVADIDFCQTHPELAHAVNVEFTRTIATSCREIGSRLVLCSTDTVFDGEQAPYQEDAAPGPLNVYAETKVAAERIVADLGAQAVIARLSLVVGLPLLGAGNSFLVRMLSAFQDGRVVSTTDREVRTPIDVVTAGRALLELAAGRQQGTFHLGGLSRVNRLQLNQTIADRFGFPQRLVVAQEAEANPKRAPRPRDVSLGIDRTRLELKTPMLTLDDGLSLILQRARSSS